MYTDIELTELGHQQSVETGKKILEDGIQADEIPIRAESDEKTYILVAHNGISRVIQSYFYEMTNAEYAAFGVKNCAVLRYDF